MNCLEVEFAWVQISDCLDKALLLESLSDMREKTSSTI